jgi:hypothetical protein
MPMIQLMNHLMAQGRDAGLGCVDAEHKTGRVTGQQVEQDEDDQRSEQQRCGKGEKAADEVEGQSRKTPTHPPPEKGGGAYRVWPCPL